MRYYKTAEPNVCWPWDGTLDKAGYGVIQDEKHRQCRAHRLAWERVNGPVPPGRYVLHRCDNPPCCNPLHLWLGTIADNNEDKRRKGRHAHGVTHPLARLTEENVRAIRDAKKRGHSSVFLAAQYGVLNTHIDDIVARRLWKHLK